MPQTHDIEDVLSSIRRLVANESNAIPEPATTPDGPTLVLEAAQRVTEPEDPFQMIRTLAQEERDGRDAAHLTDALPEDVAAITDDLVDTPENVASEDEATVIWSEDDAAPDPSDDVEEDVPEEDDVEEPVAFVHARGASKPTPETSSAPIDVPRDYAEDTDYEAEMPVDAADVGLMDNTDMSAGFTEPAVADADADADADVKAASDQKTQSLSDLSSALDDDDALRDLISEIVRQELAGELGERITRNVRKLVRREIRQILATEEFD